MCRLCEAEIIEDADIQARIRRLVHRIIERYEPQEVWLFGSFAYGDWHELSDVDLMIVADDERRFIDRAVTVAELNDTAMQVQAFVYRPDEYQQMREKEWPFLMQIIEDGVQLYARSES